MIDDKTLKLMNTEQFLYIGVIEDTKDETFAGRYRVRIIGLDGTKEDLPTENLPYAKVMNNLFCGLGFTTFFKKGSFCIIWLPLGNRNNPIILGLLPSINNQSEELDYFCDPDKKFPLEEYKNKPDINKLSTTKYDYLYNQVFQTESGHTLEFRDENPDEKDESEPTLSYFQLTTASKTKLKMDEISTILQTPGGHKLTIQDKKRDGKNLTDEPTIKIEHSKGTIINIDKEGALTLTIVKDCTTTIKGNSTLNIKGDSTLNIDGNCTSTIKGNCTIKASQNVEIKGTKINLN